MASKVKETMSKEGDQKNKQWISNQQQQISNKSFCEQITRMREVFPPAILTPTRRVCYKPSRLPTQLLLRPAVSFLRQSHWLEVKKRVWVCQELAWSWLPSILNSDTKAEMFVIAARVLHEVSLTRCQTPASQLVNEHANNRNDKVKLWSLGLGVLKMKWTENRGDKRKI